MTANLKEQIDVEERAEQILRAARASCQTMTKMAEESVADLKAHAASLGTAQDIGDLISQAEIALVNDIEVSNQWGSGPGLDIRAFYNNYILLTPPSHGCKLKLGRKRVFFFVMPIDKADGK